jgi:uncharacterized radical SAM superfamily Fe-S cluster-containing enzyme
MKIEYKDSKKNNWFLITWDLSNKCNYRCNYCPSMFHDGSLGWPKIEEVEKFVKKINELLPEKDICFRISGGEPTYWKNFIDFAKCVKSYDNSFSYLTNGSRDITYFKTMNQLTDGMILSYHPEYSKKEHFIEISKVMDCPIAVNLMDLLLIPFSVSYGIGFALNDYSMKTWVVRYSFLRLTALRGLITFVNTIDGPRNTSSAQTTPS